MPQVGAVLGQRRQDGVVGHVRDRELPEVPQLSDAAHEGLSTRVPKPYAPEIQRL